LDDRPVFEEDRRRAEAYARGGMDEERKEMALIKKEKSDKHWANHEAFTLMIEKARKEKKQEKESKSSAKLDMKEMMAKAKADKAEAAAKKAQQENGQFELAEEDITKNKEFYGDMKKKYDQRYFEKQAGVNHDEEPSQEESEIAKENMKADMMGAEEYDRKLGMEMKAANEAAIKQWEKDGKPKNCTYIEEVNDDLVDD